MKLSDYVLKFVADLGVTNVFLVTGGGAMHLNQSLAAETRITSICNSHEQASAICAEGYAKATNGLGVCMVTTGPGGTNAVTGVAGAWLRLHTRPSSSPARSSAPTACSTRRPASPSACASSACRRSTSAPSSRPSPSTP